MKCILFILFLISTSQGRENQGELIFIYNAKSGFVNEFLDLVHKNLSPNTYNCNLCAITYGTFTMKPIWTKYISSLPLKSSFTYKDKVSHYGFDNLKLPSIIFRNGSRSKVIISSEEINKLKKIDQIHFQIFFLCKLQLIYQLPLSYKVL